MPLSYYDSDTDLNLLKGKTIVILGSVHSYPLRDGSNSPISIRYGNQGSAQAQNLRDTGVENVLVANRDDSYAQTAKADGFTVENDFSKAAAVADGENDLIMPRNPTLKVPL